MSSNIPAGTEGSPTPRTVLPPLPPPKYGTRITVLSIDGGGIRGLIPSVIVAKLEEMLQDLDGEEARIVDYFDVIAGTSTGALLMACLVTPENENSKRPLKAAKDITEFYVKEGPKIFPPRQDGPLYRFGNWITRGKLAKVSILKHALTGGPMYDGEHLRSTIRELTGMFKLDDALTEVVVPTFDVRKMSPYIFQSTKHKTHQNRESNCAMLWDVLIGTTAAPTYFPAHPATRRGDDGSSKEFHLIDGGVAANNPTMLAMSYVIKKMLYRNPYYTQDGKFNYGNTVVISLGTGAVKHEATGTYTAQDCAKWSAVNWIYNRTNEHKPLLDIFSSANDNLVGFYTAAFLESHHCKDYLRIQSTLEGPTALLDKATEANMKELIKIGEEVLQKFVHKVNFNTGSYQRDTSWVRTNEQELKRYARILSVERKERNWKKSGMLGPSPARISLGQCHGLAMTGSAQLIAQLITEATKGVSMMDQERHGGGPFLPPWL